MPACPLSRKECLRNRCMWYNDRENECAIMSIARELRLSNILAEKFSELAERLQDFENDNKEDVGHEFI